MKRTTAEKIPNIQSTSLVDLDGYIVHITPITKNNGNNNHHYSFIVSLEDQTTVRVIKYLSTTPSCSLYNRLKDSIRSGQGSTISGLREQNTQYTCTMSTKVSEKELNYRPDCIRVKNISDLKENTSERLFTIEAKVCQIGDEIPVMFEQNEFKRIQKLKKTITVGDSTGALQITLWESHFDQITLASSYHMRLLKMRPFNDQLSLTTTSYTSFIKINDIENVITEIDNTLNQTRSDKGQIISIKAKSNDYICQGCGSHNIIEDATVITCNDCHSKLLNEIDVNNDYFNISIISFTHDEYNLKITKSLLIPLMSQETDPSIENSDYFKSPDFLNTIISLNVDFTYDEKTGIINIITIHNDQNSRKNSF